MRNANAQRAIIMILASTMQQPSAPHVRHADREGAYPSIVSGRPALRLAHHEVAEDLHPRHGLQFFGVDEVGVELNRI